MDMMTVLGLLAGTATIFYVMQAGGATWGSVDVRFWIGILVIILGGYLVLANKPEPRPAG